MSIGRPKNSTNKRKRRFCRRGHDITIVGQYNGFCRVCRKEGARAWRKLTKPRLTKNQWLKMRYNITLEDYNRMFKQQNGACAICKKDQSEFSKALCVDHNRTCCPGDKSCGKCVRGLLCYRCNTGIGWLEKFYLIQKDSIDNYWKRKNNP